MSTALRVQLGTGLMALALVSTTVLQVSSAAFSDTVANTGNQVTAGTVVLSAHEAATMYDTVTGLKPGTAVQRCVRMTYTGSLNADVKVYGAVTGGTGAAYFTATIERGSGLSAPGADFNCTDFVSADSFYANTLAHLDTNHTNFTDGLGSFNVDENDTVDYRISIEVADDNNAQGESATFTVSWEAQNT